ncbi:MAG: HAMP domain-containing sensor histidine kinase [Kofleriaceae bacterium]
MTVPNPRHLGWLYLLALAPELLAQLEEWAWPSLITQLALSALMLVIITLVIRRSRALSAEMHAHVESNTQLQHANRLATLGQLAAGVAHELGSPLQVIAGRAKMVASGETTGEDARELCRIILGQTDRMADIVRSLLGFARRRPPQRRASTLIPIATDVHRMLAPIAKRKSILFELDINGPARELLIDSGQIQQALTNLVMNALQAVTDHGQITIEVDELALSVIDDGPGIPAQNLDRVFEPFFTTKEVGEGTGLGLAVAHGLVRDNGGVLTVASTPGNGATFQISFGQIGVS